MSFLVDHCLALTLYLEKLVILSVQREISRVLQHL